MADERDPQAAPRRAALPDDLETTVLRAPGGRPRRFVTPDWDDDEWDDGWDDPADAAAPAASTAPGDQTSWRPVPIEAVPEASRAVEPTTPQLRREAPTLPGTPAQPPSAGRPAAEARSLSPTVGTRPDDDWHGAPLPASVVPPPPVGEAPPPIELTTEVPDSHSAYMPPARTDVDTVVIRRGDLSASARTPTRPGPSAPAWPTATGSAGTPPPGSGPTAPLPPGPASPSGPPPGQPPADGPRLTPSERLARLRGDDPTSVPADDEARTPRWLWPAIAAGVVLVLVLGTGIWWVNRDRLTHPAASVSTPSTPPVLTEGDLMDQTAAVELAAGTWQVEATDSPAPDDPTPLCLTKAPNAAAPVTGYQRRLTGPADVLHRAEAYRTVDDASAVTALRTTMLGRCSNVPVLLTQGATISGLGDEAVAVQAVVQDPSPIHHWVVLVRTGTLVTTIDVWRAGEAVDVQQVAAAAAKVLAGPCQRAQGTCPTQPAVTLGTPPSGGVAGWLTVADLPRVTPGFGRWSANEPSTTIRVIGSQCENVSFATVPGPTQRRQRTFLLTEDPATPRGFGLDELLLDFDSPEAAAAFAKTLTDNLDSCADRIPSASLGGTGTVTGTGAGDVSVSGYWRTISHPTAGSTATFRVGVATAGSRVIYLMLTPSGSYDLSDQAWADVTLRAGARSTQQQ